MKTYKGLTLHNPYIAITEKQAADELASHPCICCGKIGNYIAGDKGKLKKVDAIRYYQVGMKCSCGFINLVYLVCNDLKKYRLRNHLPAAEAIQQAEARQQLEDPVLKVKLIQTQVLLYTRKQNEALAFSTQCVAEYTNHSSVLYNHGCLLMLHGRYEEAVGFLEKVIHTDTSMVSAWFQLGHIYKHLHDYTKALSCYNMFLKASPNHIEAKQKKAECHQALQVS